MRPAPSTRSRPLPAGTAQQPDAYDAYDGSDARKDRFAVERRASDRRTSVLVRPGGCVAWAADFTDRPTIESGLAARAG